MTSFQEMGLPEALKFTLQTIQFTNPTPIQSQAIPIALENKDILGSAQTGTGKTGAFGIPLVAKIMQNPHKSALVMTPTRELAAQVMTQLKVLLGKKSKIQSALLIGGESMPKQLQQLKNSPRVFVGTPGRINDHLKRGSLRLTETDYLVLDETDRMLDMGFTDQIENVIKYMAEKRQTLLFSATLPKNIVRIAEKHLTNPVRIAIDSETAIAENIQQDILRIDETEKFTNLSTQISERKGSIIVFVKTKYSTERIMKKLIKEDHNADAIHGNLNQSRRNRVIEKFRKKKTRILVATDVAARGLDIPHVEHVINYDLPQCPEDYVHRIGRTARAGANGSALSLITPSDRNRWRAIERFLDPNSSFDPTEENKRKSKRKRKRKKRKTSSKTNI